MGELSRETTRVLAAMFIAGAMTLRYEASQPTLEGLIWAAEIIEEKSREYTDSDGGDDLRSVSNWLIRIAREAGGDG